MQEWKLKFDMYYSPDIGNILKDGMSFFIDKCNIKFFQFIEKI